MCPVSVFWEALEEPWSQVQVLVVWVSDTVTVFSCQELIKGFGEAPLMIVV